QFIRRDAGNLVTGAIKVEDRPAYAGASEVFRVFSIKLIEIGIRRREPPAGMELPVGGKLDAAMLRSWRVEHEADAGRRCRLAHQFVTEKLVEAGRTELKRVVRRPVETKIVTEIHLRLELGVIA